MVCAGGLLFNEQRIESAKSSLRKEELQLAYREDAGIVLTKLFPTDIIVLVPETYLQAQKQADMAELADAPDLGSGVPDVQVQVLLSAAFKNSRKHEEFLIESNVFGCFYFEKSNDILLQ